MTSKCIGFVLSMIIIVIFKVKLLEVNFRVKFCFKNVNRKIILSHWFSAHLNYFLVSN